VRAAPQRDFAAAAYGHAHASRRHDPESQADKLLAPIYTTYKDIETTILAHAGDIQLTLLCTKPTLDQAQRRVDELAGKLEEALEDWLYASGADAADNLEQIVLYYLGLRQSTLAVAESCTGGLLAERLTRVPGLRARSSAEPSSTPTPLRWPSQAYLRT